MTDDFQCPLFGSFAYVLLYFPTTIEFINGQFVVLCTWVIVIGLVNTICGVLTSLVFVVGSPELLLRLLAENPPYLWPKLIINLIITPFLATFVLNATFVSTPMVIITALSDWVTSILAGCLQVSVIAASNTLSEIVLILIQWCYNLWLPISILYGVESRCEYTFGFLFLIWTNGQIYQLYSSNWLPNSMPFNLFWITRIFGYCAAINPLMFLPHSITPHV